MRISITNYLDVMSSWCFWSQPAWAELKRRYADRVEFDWKIALMDPAGLPKSRKQEEWYYRRSGLMNRSAFMLRTDSYEPVLPEYLSANLVAEAARDLGIKDDTVRLALSQVDASRPLGHRSRYRYSRPGHESPRLVRHHAYRYRGRLLWLPSRDAWAVVPHNSS